MALDFPASPTTGQTYTPAGANGAVWKWDGAKWVAGGVAAGGGGSVTSVTAGTGITATPNPITVAGTVALTVPVAPTNGGTGLATYAQGDIIYASAANTLTSLAKDTGTTRFLGNTGTNNNPVWGQVPLTSGVSGVLPIANGGTGASVASAAPWVETSGDTMSGLLTLSGPPTAALHAATKAYVDSGPAQNNVGRNLIHNPLFNIAQRGIGSFTSFGYGLDRWVGGGAGGDTCALGQNVFTDAHRTQIGDEAAAYYLGGSITGTSAAGALTVVYQPIEDVRRLAGKTVTVSFWAISSLAGFKLGVSFDQSFGSGGSPSAAVQINGQSVALTTTWARYSLTFTLPSIAGKTLGTTTNSSSTNMFFWYSSGATNNVRSGNVGVQSAATNIWGVQLEIGSTMTPLEKPDPQQDLAKCQRFYQIGTCYSVAYQTSGNLFAIGVMLPVLMRATPTVVISGNTSTNLNVPAIGANAKGLVFASGGAAATGPITINMDFTASADL